MKNIINYYYQLIPEKIKQKNEYYTFNIDNTIYIFMPYYNNINLLKTIYEYLIRLNVYCHEIINNKDNNVITINNNKPYILLKVHYNVSRNINIQNILSYNILINEEKKCNWKELWCNKLDYYEYQIREFGKKYPLLKESFSYYNGLTETAICLLNYQEEGKTYNYINHQRILKNMNYIDFYNPLNLVIDVKTRDISEYFKIKFFEKENIIDEIKNYLYINKLSYNEILLFFTRLIYPSYYFDTYDEIIQGVTKEEKLNQYISKIKEYELFLKQVYIIINRYYKLPEIEWIIKM